MAEENISLVGRGAKTSFGIDAKGLSGLKAEFGAAANALSTGLGVGVLELATGSNKVKAIWESIKWSAYARVGAAGIAVLAGAFIGLTGAIRKGIRESGILEAALERVGNTKVLGNQFTAFLGSVEQARKRVGELYQFVANSKFNLGEVSNASRVLTILSGGLLGGKDDLEKFGKIAKFTNNDLEALSVTVAQLNKQIRNREDISGSIEQLKTMGVISESTASQILNLARSGASSAAIWSQVTSSLDKVAQSAGDVEPSMAELQDRYEKLRTAMAQKFGEPFLAAEREALLASIQLTEALTPAVQKIGEMLAAATAPAESLKSKLAGIAGTDWFKETLTRLAEVTVALPAVFGVYQIAKGGIKLGKTTANVFKRGVDETGTIGGGVKELAQSAKGAVSLKAGAENMAVASIRLRTESLNQLAQANLHAAAAEELRKMETAKGAEFQAAALRSDTARTAALRAEMVAMEQAAVAQTVLSETAGRAAKTNATLSTGSIGLSKALGGLSVVAGYAGSALAKAGSWLLRMSGPLLVITGLTYLLTKAWDAYAESQARAKNASDLLKSTAAANEELAAQIGLLKSLDDKTKLVTQSREALSAALEEQAKINADLSATDAERSAVASKVTGAKRNLRQAESADEGKLAPGNVEMERLQRQVQLHKEIKELIFQAEFARATGAKQVLMLYERQRDMLKIQADAAKSRDIQPAIDKKQNALTAQAKDRETIQKGLFDRRAKLLEEDKKLGEKEQTKKSGSAYYGGGGLQGLQQRRAAIQAETAQITEQIRQNRAGTAEEMKTREEITKLKEKGGKADQLDVAAQRARDHGDFKVAQDLENQAAEARSISSEEAEKAAVEASERLADMRKGSDLRKIDLDTGKKLLSITSETFEAEDKIAAAKKEGLTKAFQRTTDTKQGEITNLMAQAASARGQGSVNLADALEAQADDAQQELDNQTQAFKESTGEIDKETKERQLGRSREKTAIESAMKAHQLNEIAIMAAAKGNYAQADAATVAATKIEDAQQQLERAIQLRAAGFKEADIKSMVASEQEQRVADRKTHADAYVAQEERRLKEQSLELGVSGIGNGPKGAEAAGELTKMRDVDMFREQLAKNLENMPGQTEKATEMALQSASAEILKQQPTPGQNTVADSLTRIGGGGGVYGAVGSDPQLQAANRIASLAEEAKKHRETANELLQAIKDKIPGGVR